MIRLGVVVLVTSLSQQPPASPMPERILALPLSVGSVAMLVPHAALPEVQDRLREAVGHGDPDVRAVAARVVLVTASRGLLPVLRDRVTRETDDIAAAEQVRALATLATTAAEDRALVEQVSGRGNRVAIALAEVLGRVRPGSLVAYGSRLGPDDTPGELASALVLASVREPQIAAAVADAALKSGARTWRAFLAGRHDRNLPVDGPVLALSLESSDAHTRLYTLAYVAMIVGHPGDEIDRGVVNAVATAAEADASLASWEAALRELVRRSAKRPAREIDWNKLLVGDQSGWHLPSGLNADLLGKERGTVEKRIGGRLPDGVTFSTAASRIRPESWKQITRTAPIFAGGLVGDVMRLTGCRAGDTALAAAEIRYRPDGRPLQVTAADLPLSAECQTAAATILSLTVASVGFDGSSEASDGVLLPFAQSFIACTTPRPDEFVRRSPDIGVEPPKAVDLKPVIYPERVAKQHIQGTVTLSMVLTKDGCIREARTTRSLHPVLDVEAIKRALSGRWEPMRVEGRPMTTTVSMGVGFDPRYAGR